MIRHRRGSYQFNKEQDADAEMTHLEKHAHPLVNLNGTHVSELLAAQYAVAEAARALSVALGAATPHGRDYPLPGTYSEAREASDATRIAVAGIERTAEAAVAELMRQATDRYGAEKVSEMATAILRARHV